MEEALRDKAGLSEAEYLERYDPKRFDRPSLAVDAVIFTVTDEQPEDIRRVPDKVLRVLLVKRSGHPFLGKWALPGGFVRMDESLDSAVARVLERETGLRNVYLEQLYTWGEPTRDPRTRVISASYMALHPQPGVGTADARWFTVRERTLRTEQVETEGRYALERTVELRLSDGETDLAAVVGVTRTTQGRATRTERRGVEQGEFAFDHATMIHYALERLRNKLEWTDIAFNLVPDLFTLKELQKVYEVILGREILDTQFRRDIDRMVIPTNQMRANVGHRPARLFRFNPRWSEI